MGMRFRQFRFDWKLSLLTALLLPVLLSLGFWQLAREQEKLQLQQVYESRQQQQPVALTSLDSKEDQQYRQVEVEGSYDNTHVFLLDNRIYQGRVGYEVLLPLLAVKPAGSGDTAESETLLAFVNRGWVPAGATRDQLPQVPAVEGRVRLRGSVYVPVGEAFVLGSELAAEGWPRVIQTLDLHAMQMMMSRDTDKALFPYTIRVEEGAPGALVRYWPLLATGPEKHRGYAVQWFAMALALLALYLWNSTRAASAEASARG